MPPSPPDVVAAVREFMSSERPETAERVRAIGETASLRDAGLLDSIVFVGLVDFLEGRFGIVIPPEDLSGANLGTLAAARDYVARALAKRGGAGG